jgi:hypothetical protein
MAFIVISFLRSWRLRLVATLILFEVFSSVLYVLIIVNSFLGLVVILAHTLQLAKDHFKGFQEHLIAPSAKFIISQIMSIVTFPAVFFNRHTKPLDYDANFILGVKLVLVPHINFLSALLALAVRSQPFVFVLAEVLSLSTL